MKTTKIIRFSLLLAAFMVANSVKAQIEIGEFNRSFKYSLIKVYTPDSIPIDYTNLIAKLNKLLSNKEVFNDYQKGKEGEPTTAFENKIVRGNGKTLFYRCIVIGKDDEGYEGIKLYKWVKMWKVEVRVVKNCGDIEGSTYFEAFTSFESAKEFAESLYYVRKLYRQHIDSIENNELMKFEKVAKTYREQTNKPTVSEEQRKYIVQANAMNDKKDYEKAIGLYNQAIEISPVTYPSAYYNLALLYAQTSEFGLAIFNMKRYLLLVPDAPDARAAQDKIYEWEAELEN